MKRIFVAGGTGFLGYPRHPGIFIQRLECDLPRPAP